MTKDDISMLTLAVSEAGERIAVAIESLVEVLRDRGVEYTIEDPPLPDFEQVRKCIEHAKADEGKSAAVDLYIGALRTTEDLLRTSRRRSEDLTRALRDLVESLDNAGVADRLVVLDGAPGALERAWDVLRSQK